ncbi:MAG TPA: hypothetical protein PKL59_20730, partial [Nitrospira sp.]|nr:hypothetical protein [Nitrospira sp.]
MLRFFTSTVALITTSLLLLTACSREGDKVYVRTLYAPIQQAANSASSPSAHAGYAYFGEALELVGQSTNPSMLSVKASRNGAQGLVHRALVTKLPAEIDMLRSAGAAPSVVLVATPPRDTNSQLEVTIPIGLVTADLDGRLKLKLKAGDTVVLQGGPFKASTLTEVFGSEVAATELDTLQIFDGQKFVQPGKTGPALPSKTDVAPVSVNAMYEYSLPSLPLIVAVKKDLFKRRGVNVTLQGLKGRSRLAIEQTEILHGHG